MNQQIKQQWIEALRSGEYSQTQNQLRDHQGYCCLGVLCDLYCKVNEGSSWEDGGDLFRLETNMGEYEFVRLPISISEWAGLHDDNPNVEYGEVTVAISDLNDKEQLSFNQIAAIIEEQL
jgi:hypothetical protein